MTMSLLMFLQAIMLTVSNQDELTPPDLPHKSLNKILFVITNRNGSTFALPLMASMLDMYETINESYPLPTPFKIEFLHQTLCSTNQRIMEIPDIRSMITNLYEIWGDGFRIPITVYPIAASPEDIATFSSLLMMFRGSDGNMFEFDWYQFIFQCLNNRQCFVEFLCHKFNKRFRCGDGKIKMINFTKQKITGTVDLTFLPSTVTTLLLDRCSFTALHGMDRLAGKELKYLDIRRNPFEIDLDWFTRLSPKSIGSPLRALGVNSHQISSWLLGIRRQDVPPGISTPERYHRKVHNAAAKWFINSSILDKLALADSRPMYRNGFRITHYP